MSLIEFAKHPIYGSERIPSDTELHNRTTSMYRLVVEKNFQGHAPKRKSVVLFKDFLGKDWTMDVIPRRSALYVRRHTGQSNTAGFKTDPTKASSRTGENFSVLFWKSMKSKRISKPDREWMLQESEVLLDELISNF